ncbi:MAG TPA: hypothetical protein VGN61_04150 [Verrucomicrobiae bacterium]|jgi:hypothetical protein
MIAFLIHVWLYVCLFAGGFAWLLVMAAAALGSNMERRLQDGPSQPSANSPHRSQWIENPFAARSFRQLTPTTKRRIWAAATILL